MVEQFAEKLSIPGRLLVQAIAYYYNGIELEIDGRRRRIGEGPPPTIQDLLLNVYKDHEEVCWDRQCQDAYRLLGDTGYIKDERWFHKPISWAPTRRGRQLMEYILKPNKRVWHQGARLLYDVDGLTGDLNEGIKHRVGVETVRTFARLNDHYDNFVPYPETDGRSYDAFISGDNGPVKCEIITTYNKDLLLNTYQAMANQNDPVLYIFGNGELMHKTLGLWTKREDINAEIVNYPLNEKTRSVKHGKEYVRRSCKSEDYITPGISEAVTINCLYELCKEMR